MAVKVTLTNKAQVTSPQYSKQDTTAIHMSRAVYQTLGSRTLNKTIIDKYDNEQLTKEYTDTLNDLNDLFLKKNYPTLAANIVVKEGIVEIDEYLGSLGVSQDYPYAKDIINIPAWLDGNPDFTPMRVLFTSNNQYLVNSDGDVLTMTNT